LASIVGKISKKVFFFVNEDGLQNLGAVVQLFKFSHENRLKSIFIQLQKDHDIRILPKFGQEEFHQHLLDSSGHE